MKTKHYHDCAHFSPGDESVCSLGYAVRFYQPKSAVDQDWGWKRRCADFDQIVLLEIEVSK